MSAPFLHHNSGQQQHQKGRRSTTEARCGSAWLCIRWISILSRLKNPTKGITCKATSSPINSTPMGVYNIIILYSVWLSVCVELNSSSFVPFCSLQHHLSSCQSVFGTRIHHHSFSVHLQCLLVVDDGGSVWKIMTLMGLFVINLSNLLDSVLWPSRFPSFAAGTARNSRDGN